MDTRDTLMDMGKHSRLSKGQRTLAAFIAILAVALTPVFFAVMFTAVTHLLAASFGGWSWTVPVATEISFTLLFLLWVLLEWRDRAPGWLRVAPYPFAAASLWLNVYSARGNLPGMVGHGVVTIAFFIPILALKAAVTRLTVSDEERKRGVATRDAIDHARDILRAADPWWRFRAPVLLRRQLRSRRLPAAVAEAIALGVTFGGSSKWEPAVEAWITRSLALPEGVTAQLAAAREAASRSAAAGTSGAIAPSTAEPPSAAADASTAAGADAGTNASTARTASGSTSAKRKPALARATDEELAEVLLPLLGGPNEVTKYAAVEAIRAARGKGVSYERAERILELGRRLHRERRVVDIAQRR